MRSVHTQVSRRPHTPPPPSPRRLGGELAYQHSPGRSRPRPAHHAGASPRGFVFSAGSPRCAVLSPCASSAGWGAPSPGFSRASRDLLLEIDDEIAAHPTSDRAPIVDSAALDRLEKMMWDDDEPGDRWPGVGSIPSQTSPTGTGVFSFSIEEADMQEDTMRIHDLREQALALQRRLGIEEGDDSFR
uniref:Uncharacterized protein n=1 Tax=Haptolina ericina TaxID=156174 RepID=A0A7S3B005_9EUKA